jgi:hypothetical protein
MDKIVIKKITKLEKQIFKKALIGYMSMFEGREITQLERITLSIIAEIIDKMDVKIMGPIQSNLKLKYYQAFYAQLALLEVLHCYDEFDHETVVLHQFKDRINQQL